MIKLAIVSPCYNEEAVLKDAVSQMAEVFKDLITKQKITSDSFLLYVNDGSEDNTWNLICQLAKEYSFVKGVNLAHNAGHQNAIMAGMMVARHEADAVITMDCDLQDDVKAIEKMLDKHEEGADIVYGVKVDRHADSWKKKTSAQIFYKMLSWMGVNVVYNHADFRFLTKRVLDALSEFPERNLYLRGMIPLIGFKSDTVEDVLSPRLAGKSKYTLSKMMRLATDGVTSFSTRPMELIIYLGLLMLFVAFGMFVYVSISLLIGHYSDGWASMMMSIWAIGSIITLSIGIAGLYIGRIYIEVKRRPLYTIESRV